MKTIFYIPGEQHYIMLAPYTNPQTIRQIFDNRLNDTTDNEEDDDILSPSTIYWYIRYPVDHQIEFSDLVACLNTSIISTDQRPILPFGAITANCYCGKMRLHSLAKTNHPMPI